MANPAPDSKLPAYAAFGFIAVGLALGALFGIAHGTLLGGVLAGMGVIPALLGMWKGIQQEKQGTLALSVIAVLMSLCIGGALIVLRIIYYIHH